MTTMQLDTPSGNAFVWRLPNSADGFHFLLRSENGSERYYSQSGSTFSRAYETGVRDLLLGPKETDRERVRVLRRLWEKFIDAEFARQKPI
jgi:hypothetical protein